ncbi:MAG: beta-N-acetylglucosaminidase domain-containing protein [Alistipes sp.]|nr:beta-N-acetylglucosaminidase domain-containing protein [Alistipes sp.]
MNRILKTTIFIAVTLFGVSVAGAQDLQSQRGESQSVDKVPGEVLDHDGLMLNPIPQHVERMFEEVDITRGFALRGKAKGYAEELGFLKIDKRGLPINIVCSERAADKLDMEEIVGTYMLKVSKAGVTITAADDTGVFYAIQTLRQIIESEDAHDGGVREVTVYDYPNLKYRGVVEGFYGEPWSHETRLSLIDFYGRYKMNYYIYGPKDDPYHSCPNWRLPYPDDEAKNIHELVEACRRNRVNFVWAIHPGADIKWNEEDYNNLLSKFESMYELGVRAFAIHFDDISGEGANPLKQTELLNRLNEEFVAAKRDVASLIVCPTDYTRLWANPTERGSLVRYGETLHPSIDVFWTGDAVCSNMTTSTMEWVNSRIQRPALFWWNFPVTDYARHIVMQGPVYGLSADIDDDYARGIVTNPMEHGEASKLAMFSVADYAWNVEKYNPMDSWYRAFSAVAPEVKEAYQLFAIHSCDTETGYRRLESWLTETFRMNEYTPELAAKLMEEFKAIEEVPHAMLNCNNKALLGELAPWLYEFGKLGTRCRKALEMLINYHSAPYNKFAGFWDAYIANKMSKADEDSYLAHCCGTMKLQPFYENVMDDMAAAYYFSLTGELASTLNACGTYRSIYSTQSKAMFDNEPETYYHSGVAQRTDHWVGVDMQCVRSVSAVNVIQGRNSVDDVDYFDHAILEYSLDGETWMALGEPMVGVYDVMWRGEAVDARYVRLRKLESSKTNWLAVRSFEINPVPTSEYHIDGNPFTSLPVGVGATIDVPAEATHCHLLLGKLMVELAPYYRLLDEAGNVVGEGLITSSDWLLTTDGKVARIEISGVECIYEAIFKREVIQNQDGLNVASHGNLAQR